MGDKAYVIRFKDPHLSTQPVVAANAEIHAEHMGATHRYWFAPTYITHSLKKTPPREV
jgi:hypothetical protein